MGASPGKWASGKGRETCHWEFSIPLPRRLRSNCRIEAVGGSRPGIDETCFHNFTRREPPA